MSQRATKIRKKQKPKKNIYLFFSLQNDDCLALLEILAENVKDLAVQIQCVDVDEYEVMGVNEIPAIDDGENELPFEGIEAFMWVLNKCYKMFSKGQIKEKDVLITIEAKIQLLIQKNSRKVNGGIIDKGFKRKNKDQENPLDKFKSGLTARKYAPASFKVPSGGRLKERWNYLEQHRKKEALNKRERVLNSEKFREQMVEEAKMEWISKGIVDPTTGESMIDRHKERNTRKMGLNETDIHRFNQDRLEMLNPIMSHYKPVLDSPSKFNPVKVGRKAYTSDDDD